MIIKSFTQAYAALSQLKLIGALKSPLVVAFEGELLTATKQSFLRYTLTQVNTQIAVCEPFWPGTTATCLEAVQYRLGSQALSLPCSKQIENGGLSSKQIENGGLNKQKAMDPLLEAVELPYPEYPVS